PNFFTHAFIFPSSSPRAHPLPRRFFEGALIQLPHTGRARDGVLHPHRDLRRGEPGEPQRRGALDVRGETLPPQERITRRHPRVGDCFPPCADVDEEPLVGNRDLRRPPLPRAAWEGVPVGGGPFQDRKSTRLNSSHVSISYAVLYLKTKKLQSHGQLV